MKVWLAPNIPLTIVLFAALAAVVLRTAAVSYTHLTLPTTPYV